MIESILPDRVVAVDTRGDRSGMLFPEEEAALGRCVEKRRREFVTARDCAREALVALGLPPLSIPVGKRGEPRWPPGIVGSITHCAGYRACALARTADILTIGIDAEPNEALPEGVLTEIAVAEELAWLRRLEGTMPVVSWDRLLFSAKEAVYKAWFPLVGRPLGFEDAVITVDPEERTFFARLQAPRLSGRLPGGFSGRWLARDGLVLTACSSQISS